MSNVQPITAQPDREPGAAVCHIIIGSPLVNERRGFNTDYGSSEPLKTLVRSCPCLGIPTVKFRDRSFGGCIGLCCVRSGASFVIILMIITQPSCSSFYSSKIRRTQALLVDHVGISSWSHYTQFFLLLINTLKIR